MNDSVGSEIAKQILDQLKKNSNLYNVLEEGSEILEAVIRNMPLRNLIVFGNVSVDEKMIDVIVRQLNDGIISNHF